MPSAGGLTTEDTERTERPEFVLRDLGVLRVKDFHIDLGIQRDLTHHLHLCPALLHLGYMPAHKAVHGHHAKQREFGNNCFGCGPENETGLKLKFVLDEDRGRFVCRFRLQGRFVGPPAHAHGGIIATILDEAMGKVNRLHNLVALTSTMDITYVKPVPLYKALRVEGWEERVEGREHYRGAEIRNSKGEVLARSKGKFIEIDPHRMFAKHLKEKHSDGT